MVKDPAAFSNSAERGRDPVLSSLPYHKPNTTFQKAEFYLYYDISNLLHIKLPSQKYKSWD